MPPTFYTSLSLKWGGGVCLLASTMYSLAQHEVDDTTCQLCLAYLEEPCWYYLQKAAR